jgi:shikimate dehydrogenase
MIALEIAGLSVTLPHKERVLPELDEVEPLARDLGAANTIARSGGRLRGYNTDAEAALAPLRGKVDLRNKRVALLGAGGAARAFAFRLPREGCAVTVYNRTEARARSLAEQAGIAWRRWEDLARDPYDLLIQATPVGMHPEVEQLPVPEKWLRGSLGYDIIYNPVETALLRAARSRWIDTLGGVEMFVEQAVAQFELFTGVSAPRETMRRAVQQALGGPAGT